MPSVHAAFTASDLATRRREVLDASRNGVALVRDTDGTLIAMMRAELMSFREEIGGFNRTLGALIASLAQEAPAPASLGAAAFAAGWSQERRAQLVADLAEAIALAESMGDPAPVVGLLEVSRPHSAPGGAPLDAAAAFAGISPEDQAVLSGTRRPVGAHRPAAIPG